MSDTTSICNLEEHKNLENFVHIQLKLLEIERDAEIEENK